MQNFEIIGYWKKQIIYYGVILGDYLVKFFRFHRMRFNSRNWIYEDSICSCERSTIRQIERVKLKRKDGKKGKNEKMEKRKLSSEWR